MDHFVTPAGLQARGECEDYGGSYTSHATSTTPSFKLYCDHDYDADNMAQTWTSNFAACMDACAGYNTGNAATCLGVSYHAYSTSGLSNCFLKSSNNLERLTTPDHLVWSAFVVQKNPPPPPTTVTKVSTAVQVSTSVKTSVRTSTTVSSVKTSTPTTTPTVSSSPTPPVPAPTNTAPTESTGATTQGWIAGPVIGALAGLALVGFLVRYFMMRRNRPEAATGGLFSREAAEA